MSVLGRTQKRVTDRAKPCQTLPTCQDRPGAFERVAPPGFDQIPLRRAGNNRLEARLVIRAPYTLPDLCQVERRKGAANPCPP